jgi:WXG100 family type VII secretion target
MSANEVMINYEDMAKVAQTIDGQVDQVQAVIMRINNQLDVLRGGMWEGENARYFYREMDNTVLPGLQRLYQALVDSHTVTQQVISIFEQAEEEGAVGFPAS